MNLATIEAIREGIAGIAQQAETGWSGDDYNAGAAEMRRRVDNYLCELIAENSGEVKEPEVFRYIEVHKIGAFAHNPAIHREKAQEPGNMIMWMRRIKELEVQINSTAYFVTVCEYDSEQLLIDQFLKTDKDSEPEILWDELEDWVRYVAMDEDGQWYAYDCKPICVEEQWALDKTKSEYNAYRTGIIPFTAPDWRTSLRQRPAKTTEQC